MEEFNKEEMLRVGQEILRLLGASELTPMEQIVMFDGLAYASKKAYLFAALLGEDIDAFLDMKFKDDLEKVIKEAEEAINGN